MALWQPWAMAGASAGCSLLLSVQSAGVASTLRGPRSITPQISMPDLLLLPLQLHHRKAVGGGKGEKCIQRSGTLCQVGRRAGELYAAAAACLCRLAVRHACWQSTAQGDQCMLRFCATCCIWLSISYGLFCESLVQRSDTKMSLLLLSESFETYFF